MRTVGLPNVSVCAKGGPALDADAVFVVNARCLASHPLARHRAEAALAVSWRAFVFFPAPNANERLDWHSCPSRQRSRHASGADLFGPLRIGAALCCRCGDGKPDVSITDKLSFRCPHMSAAMGGLENALQIFISVVSLVLIAMMDVVTWRNRTMMMFPNVAMKEPSIWHGAVVAASHPVVALSVELEDRMSDA